ncbi:MAG: hypothetical protein EXS67_02960 [Candidatus Margulisbacteria bacterium]|nr:hypothetical protein [Candidatus Margulisiibacteriota bacterium]
MFKIIAAHSSKEAIEKIIEIAKKDTSTVDKMLLTIWKARPEACVDKYMFNQANLAILNTYKVVCSSLIYKTIDLYQTVPEHVDADAIKELVEWSNDPSVKGIQKECCTKIQNLLSDALPQINVSVLIEDNAIIVQKKSKF